MHLKVLTRRFGRTCAKASMLCEKPCNTGSSQQISAYRQLMLPKNTWQPELTPDRIQCVIADTCSGSGTVFSILNGERMEIDGGRLMKIKFSSRSVRLFGMSLQKPDLQKNRFWQKKGQFSTIIWMQTPWIWIMRDRSPTSSILPVFEDSYSKNRSLNAMYLFYSAWHYFWHLTRSKLIRYPFILFLYIWALTVDSPC
jgi:hypothetical protein